MPAWLWLAAYVVAVTGSTPFTAGLAASLGSGPAGRAVLVAAPVAVIGVLAALVVRGLSWAALRATVPAWGIIAGLYLVVWMLLCQRPIEGIHLAQYAVMGCLAVRALGETLPRRWAYPAAGGFVVASSWASELFQSFLPDRVYDLRDVALDGIGGLLGLALVWQSERSVFVSASR
jgi:VanZ family protein